MKAAECELFKLEFFAHVHPELLVTFPQGIYWSITSSESLHWSIQNAAIVEPKTSFIRAVVIVHLHILLYGTNESTSLNILLIIYKIIYLFFLYYIFIYS